MLTPVNLRFAELIKELGLTKNAFAQSLSKTASVVQHLIDGRNKPGYDLLCKVFEIYPNVSKDWLMEGQGPMLLTGPPRAVPTAPAVLPVPPAPAVALKKSAEAPSLFAIQVAEEVAEALAASAPQFAPRPMVPPAAPLVAEDAPSVVAPIAVPPAPVVAVAPAPAPDMAVGAALQTQYLLHQLALAEMRNQHLLEQQSLLRQMLEMARG